MDSVSRLFSISLSCFSINTAGMESPLLHPTISCFQLWMHFQEIQVISLIPQQPAIRKNRVQCLVRVRLLFCFHVAFRCSEKHISWVYALNFPKNISNEKRFKCTWSWKKFYNSCISHNIDLLYTFYYNTHPYFSLFSFFRQFKYFIPVKYFSMDGIRDISYGFLSHDTTFACIVVKCTSCVPWDICSWGLSSGLPCAKTVVLPWLHPIPSMSSEEPLPRCRTINTPFVPPQHRIYPTVFPPTPCPVAPQTILGFSTIHLIYEGHHTVLLLLCERLTQDSLLLCETHKTQHYFWKHLACLIPSKARRGRQIL